MSQTPPVRTPTSVERHVHAHAAATTSESARLALERAFPKLEWEQEVIDQARAYRNGDLRPISAEELDQILGLSDTPVDMSIVDDVE